MPGPDQPYRVEIVRSAAKELAALPRPAQARVAKKIDELGANPRPTGSVKLAGSANQFRIRVGDYRVLYEIDDGVRVVAVFRIGARKDVYRP